MVNQADSLSVPAEWFKREERIKKLNVKQLINPLLCTFSMKFSKPRILLENNYPDLDISQPALLKRLVDEIIYPPENSSISDYIDTTIVYLKNKLKDKAKKVNINAIGLGESLFFAKLCLTDNNNTHNAVRTLIDTGAANSLLHESIVQKYKIPNEPVSLRLCTANGFVEEYDSTC